MGLVVGIVIIASGYFYPPFASSLNSAGIHEFHFLGIVFALLVSLMLLTSIVAPRLEPWKMVYTKEVDLTPWHGAKKASLVLFILVIIIYAAFAV